MKTIKIFGIVLMGSILLLTVIPNAPSTPVENETICVDIAGRNQCGQPPEPPQPIYLGWYFPIESITYKGYWLTQEYQYVLEDNVIRDCYQIYDPTLMITITQPGAEEVREQLLRELIGQFPYLINSIEYSIDGIVTILGLGEEITESHSERLELESCTKDIGEWFKLQTRLRVDYLAILSGSTPKIQRTSFYSSWFDLNDPLWRDCHFVCTEIPLHSDGDNGGESSEGGLP